MLGVGGSKEKWRSDLAPSLAARQGGGGISEQTVQCCSHVRLPASPQRKSNRVLLPAAVLWTGALSRARVISVQRTCLIASERCQVLEPPHSNGQGAFSTEE